MTDGGAVENPCAHQASASASRRFSECGRPRTTSLSPARIAVSGSGLNSIVPILTLDADDDDAVALPQVGLENGLVGERRSRVDGNFFDRQLQILGAGRQLDEIDNRRTQRGLRNLHRTDLVRRNHPIGARPLQLLHRVLGLGSPHDEEIRVAARAR